MIPKIKKKRKEIIVTFRTFGKDITKVLIDLFKP
jgi:hypothetical protein